FRPASAAGDAWATMTGMLLFSRRAGGVVAAGASLLCLFLSPRASADAPELALAVEGGVAWTHSGHTYRFFYPEDGPDRSESVSAVGPAGALHLELGWKVAS